MLTARRAAAIVLLLLFFSGCKESAETAVPKAVEQLQSKDAHQRNAAAQRLSAYGGDAADAVKPLTRALWDNNMGVRTSAAYALRKIDTKEARQALADYKKAKENLQHGGR